MSFATLVVILYFTFGTPSGWPWYYPGVTLLSVIVLALLLDELIVKNPQRMGDEGSSSAFRPRLKRYAAAFTITPVLLTLLVTLCAAYQARIDQRIVCDKHLKQIGLWLHDHALVRDRVFLEPFGYIGFYSNLKMYGGFGQSSPELVAARRAYSCSFQDCWPALISDLKPEWLVLRPGEADKIRTEDPTLLDDVYTLEKTFDVGPELATYRFLPGRGMLEISEKFLVYRRKIPATSS
jgi:hypothetical protein